MLIIWYVCSYLIIFLLKYLARSWTQYFSYDLINKDCTGMITTSLDPKTKVLLMHLKSNWGFSLFDCFCCSVCFFTIFMCIYFYGIFNPAHFSVKQFLEGWQLHSWDQLCITIRTSWRIIFKYSTKKMMLGMYENFILVFHI